MKTNAVLITSLLGLFVVSSSCNNDDNNVTITPETKEEPKEEPVNQAPGSFDLIAVGNDEIMVDLSPTFSWNQAVDPDGDMVTYDFYLGNKSEPLQPLALDHAITSIDQELSFSNEYEWKVVAKDSLGASSESETFSFSTRNLNPPTNLINKADFSGRRSHGLVSFQNRLWLFSGESGENVASGLGKKEKDLWYSDDGKKWIKSVDPAPFGYRNLSTPIVFKDKLYIIGGLSSKPGSGSFEVRDYKNDVWESNTGTDWTQVQFNSLFSKRYGHSMVVFKNKIWLYGGADEDGNYLNDMYSSEDGARWDVVSGNLIDISERAFAKFTVFNDKLYLIGGRNKDFLLNEIWESENGVDWRLVAQGGEVPVNILFDVFIYRDKMILVDHFVENRIWYSDDAITWKSVTENPQFNKREASASVLYNDKIFVMGGLDRSNGSGDVLNDVWVVE